MTLSLAFGVRWSGVPRRGLVRFLVAAAGYPWNGRRGKCGIGDGGEVFLGSGWTAGEGQKHATLRLRPLIRPSGTFSRRREKGWFSGALLLRSGVKVCCLRAIGSRTPERDRKSTRLNSSP